MLRNRYINWQLAFDGDHVNFWSQMGRFNNLMVIINVSTFFLTGKESEHWSDHSYQGDSRW